MLSEDKKGKEVDDISIAFSMPEESRAEVIEAFDRVETTAHFNKFLEEIEGLWLKRKTIEACHGIIQMASERGSRALDVVEKGGSEFSQLSLKEKSKLKTGAEVVQAAWEGILERQKVGGVNGVPSGIKSLDKMCCGWQKNDLITLAARTSVGKTAFSIEMALGALRAGKTVQFFSLEMVNESVMERMLANVSGVPVRVMVDKVMTEGQIKAVEKARQFLSVAPLFMEDAGDMTVSTIRAKARKLARKGLDMIVVDYCQIVKPEDSKISREQQVSSITWGLKTLAKELKIPVIMLSQVNRNADGTNACPRLSDLADSDKVGRDADLVLMLWKKDDGSETKTFIEVAKQRNGRLGPIELDFKASLQKFEEKITSSLN
jgi:replicative DNA helicase